MGIMKPYNEIHDCGQPYVIYIFMPPLSVEFTYIFTNIMILRPWSSVVVELSNMLDSHLLSQYLIQLF